MILKAVTTPLLNRILEIKLLLIEIEKALFCLCQFLKMIGMVPDCATDDAYVNENDMGFFWLVLIKYCHNSLTPKSGYNMTEIMTKSVSVDFLNRQFKLLFAMFIAWRKTCLSASSWLQVASTWSWGWFLRVVLLKAVTTSFLNRKYNLSWKILKQLPFVCVNA